MCILHHCSLLNRTQIFYGCSMGLPNPSVGNSASFRSCGWALGTAPAFTARCSQTSSGSSEWPQQATKCRWDLLGWKTWLNGLLKFKIFTKFSTNIFSGSLNPDCFGLLLPPDFTKLFNSPLLWWDEIWENPLLQLRCVAGTCLWTQGRGSSLLERENLNVFSLFFIN